MIKKFPSIVQLAIGLAILIGASPAALGEEFYKGKILRIVVGYPPGGGYDTYTRVAARHMSRYIPGNPAIVVQNMDGEASVFAANYLYNQAKPDGLTLGVFNSTLILYQVLGLGNVAIKIDGRKLNWIGSPGKGSPSCSVMGFTGLKTFKDVLNSRKPLKMGASSASSELATLPKVLNRTIGTNFDVITGYGGTPTIRMFLQRRELDGVCLAWDSMKIVARPLLDAKGEQKLIPFIIHNRWDDPEVKNLPLIPDVIKARGDEKNIDIYNVYVAPYNFRRPVVAPPGVAKERIEILRQAYKATMNDPQYLAEAKESKLATEYVSAEEIYQGVDKILRMSPEVKDVLQVLMQEKR